MPEQESARQKKQGKTERTHRAGALNASPPAEELMAWDISSYLIGDMSFNPPFHRHAAILSEAPSDEVKATLARQLQQTYGNHYVQRLINSLDVHADRVFAKETGSPIQQLGIGRDVAVQRQDEEPEQEAAGVQRIIAKVVTDWDPPKPATGSSVQITGTTLADVESALNSLAEWGTGGGFVRSEAIPAGTSTNLTVKLHANLVKRLPKWNDYAKASEAARKEWDRMMEKLEAHEQRHVDIAIEEDDKLAADLVGKEIDQIVPMVTATNAEVQKRQDQLDSDTDHGSKQGVLYGDVYLDTSIT